MAIYGQMVIPQKYAGGGLPTNGQTSAPYVSGQGVSERLSDAGARIAGQGAQQSAQALGELGRAVRGATLKLEDVYIRYQETKARDAYNRYVQEEMETRPNWDKLQGSNAIDEKNGVIAQKSRWQREARDRHTEGLSTMARNMFIRQADQYDAGVNQWALQKVNREMEVYQDSTDKGTVGIATQRALNDPSYLPQAMGIILAVNERKGARKGWSPEAVYAQTQDDVGVMYAGAIGNMVMTGDLQGAMSLFSQARQYLPAEKAAMLQQHIGSGLISQVRAQVEAGDIAGARRTLESAGGPAFAGGGGQFSSQTIAARAAQYAGTKYGGVGGFDCSSYVRTIGKDQVAPQYRHIFEGSSEHMLDTAGRLTGKLYRGAEVNAGTVGAGWLIGIAEPNARHVKTDKANRPNDIGHVAITYEENGVVMVTENASGAGVRSLPLAQYLEQNKGRTLFAANLTALPQSGGAQGVPAGYREYTGERGGSIAERQHNPGNIRHNGKDYDYYQSDADGWRDMAAVLRKPGYQNLTVRQIAERYVTGHVGGKVVDSYFQAIQKEGFSLDEKPNLQDPMVLARLMRGMAVGESPLGQHYKPEEIYALLTGGAQAQPQPQAQAPAVKMSKDVKETYDAFMDQVQKGWMPIERFQGIAEEWAKDSRPDVARRGREILAALQQGQPQPGAPVQAPAMQSPAGVLPAGPAGGTFLSPAQQYQGQAMLNRGSENQATKILLGLKDAETKARLSGDTSMLEDIAGGLRALGSDKAEQVQRRVDFWKGIEQTRQWAVQATLPQLAEQIQAVDRQIAPETAKSLPVEELERLHDQKELLVTMAKERASALKEDPAMAADKDPGSGITEGQTPGDKVRSRLGWQERQGVGEFDRKALTKLEAENIKQNWKKASSEQKAGRLGELVKIYGEHAPQVLSEIGISPLEQDVSSAVLFDGAMANRATEVFRIMALNPKEIPGLEKVPLDEVQSALNDSEVYQAVLRHYQATLDPASSTMRAQMEDFAKRAKKIGKSDKEIREFLDLGRKAYVDDNAAVVVPKGMTEEQVEAGLKWAMDGLLKKFLQEGRPDLKGGPAGYTVGEEMSRLKAAGLWVASPDGRSFILMDSATKKPVANAKGELFTVTRDDVTNYLRGSGVELSAGDEDE